MTSSRLRTPTLTTVLAAFAAAVALAAPPASWAAVEIGQTDPAADPGGSCIGTSVWVQSATGGAPGYAVPSAGVVTSWSHHANVATGRELALSVLRPAGGDYTAVGASEVEILAADTLNSFSTRVPVAAGDLIGVWVGNVSLGMGIGGGASCLFDAGAGDEARYQGLYATIPSTGSPVTLAGGFLSSRVNVSAVVEPDADGDGYGDETQDGCPTDAATQGACPALPDPPVDAKPAPRTLPKLTVRARARQSLEALGTRRIPVVLRSDVATAAVVKGAVRVGPRPRVFRLVRAAVALRAGVDRKVRIALPAKAREAAVRALGKGRRVRLRLEVTAVDADGDRAVVRHVVRLTP